MTSQRPTLHWVPVLGTDDFHVEVCHDRGCLHVEQAFGASGTSARVPEILAPGVHFWRVSNRASAGTPAAASLTWEFFVTHRDAPVDTSWGTTPDFNGDGYAEVVVGASFSDTVSSLCCTGTNEPGRVDVYPGSASGLARTHAVELIAPNDALGDFADENSAVSAGDVNGDGFADLVVGASCAPFSVGFCGGPGRVYIYLGSPTGLATSPGVILTGPDGTGGEFGRSVSGAGDVNGDGYADIVVGADRAPTTPDGHLGSGRAYLYFGSPTGLAATATTLAPSPRTDAFGAAVADAGDVNGDGYADFMVGSAGDLRASLYLGSATGPSVASPLYAVAHDRCDIFWRWVADAGDINGDGYTDVVVSSVASPSGSTAVYVYLGSGTGLTSTPSSVLAPVDPSGLGFGRIMAGAGDVNGDGYDDLAVEATEVGTVYVYPGSAMGSLSDPWIILTNPLYNGDDLTVAGAGDVNGDSYPDIIVGTPRNGSGVAFVYLGSSSGLDTTPRFTLTGPGPESDFGSSVASAWHGFGRRLPETSQFVDAVVATPFLTTVRTM